MITLVDVTKTYRLDDTTTITPINNVSLEIRRGEFLMLVGRSGSGKTTLLNLCLGLINPTSGQVLFEGMDIQKLNDRELSLLRQRKIGFVFQFQSMLPNLNVLENVAMPAVKTSRVKGDAFQRAAELLSRVGLKERMKVYPRQLSAGELRRVAIARALINQPELILADEPTADLDAATEARVISLLKSIHESGITVVMITHNMELVRYSTRALRVECGNLIPVNREENVFHPPDQVLSCASLDAGERRDARLENRDSVSPVPLDWMSMAGKARFPLTRALAVLGAVTGLTALVLVLVGGIPSSVQPPSLPIGLPSGTSISASPPTDPATRAITLNGLASMQLYDVVAVKFNALMSFSFTGTTVDHPADFSVLQIPITWTDTSFIGQRQDISPGTNILYLAEGRVSPDGLRLLSLVYSRKVNQDAGNGSFYRVTLSDLPLTNVIKEASEGKGVYEKKGADLKNNVIKIEYVDGQRSEGQMDSLTTFIGADWTSTNPVPALKLTFSKAGGTPDEAAAM